MALKLAVVTDLHFSEANGLEGERLGYVADILLQRAVYRINRVIRPDCAVFLGDLINEGDGPHAPQLRQRLQSIIGQLEMPAIIIPGNHDGDPDVFYRDFPRPPDWLDLCGYRLVPFIDLNEPEFNARRTAAGLQRMRDARAGFDGPIIQLQHVSLFPPGTSECPYNYNNIDEVLERMRESGIRLSVSGHYHTGIDCLRTAAGTFTGGRALCEVPFTVTEIVIDGEEVSAIPHSLQLPRSLKLHDYHVHTPLAYCADNMEIGKTMLLADLFGLAGLAFSEHSGQLYFNRDDYWSARCLVTGAEHAPPDDDRMDQYLRMTAAVAPPARVGLEVDCDYSGQPLLKARDRDRVEFLTGALHVIPSVRAEVVDTARVADEFLATLETFLAGGIAILAHPFRLFRRAGLATPGNLYEPTARLLKRHGVAAEINFHINEPDPEFIMCCLRTGVRLAFGSDAHNLAEIGDFAMHLNLLKECGVDGNLDEVILRL